MLNGTLQTLQVAAAAALTGCLLSTPAAGKTVYHWVTEDGTYVFTDDKKTIPKRYEERVEVRALKPLQDYARFTPVQTPPASAPPEPSAAAPAPAAVVLTGVPTGVGPTVSMRTGDDYSPILDVSPGDSPEPVVVEKQRFRPEDSVATRTNTIVRQGDRVLTIIKPRLRNSNVSEFGDEDEVGD